jgi:ferredoxin
LIELKLWSRHCGVGWLTWQISLRPNQKFGASPRRAISN